MEKTTLVLMVVAVALVLMAGVQAVQLSELKAGGGTGAAVTSGGAIDTTGWTEDEKMMYEHHGTLPTKLQQSASAPKPASSGMVGGC